jgi:hypothetical protein
MAVGPKYTQENDKLRCIDSRTQDDAVHGAACGVGYRGCTVKIRSVA